MKLTMKRKGSFRCDWTNTHNKCGIGTDTNPVYQYDCLIETADILDEQGFVFDQLEIDTYFQQKYAGRSLISGYANKTSHPAKSCEIIALDAVRDVKRMIENHMLGHSGMSLIYRIAVTISFGDQAMLTAEWTS